MHDARRIAREDDLVIVDGSAGVMLIDPDELSLRYYRQQQEEEKKYYASLIQLKESPARTRDGELVRLQANIELPRDFETVREVGASGVGLYRTEFLYMNREAPPEEEEHYETYLGVLDTMAGLPLTIRTLDLGADKQGGRRQAGRPGPVKPGTGAAGHTPVPEGARVIPATVKGYPARIRPRGSPLDDPHVIEHPGNQAGTGDDRRDKDGTDQATT